MQCRLQVYQLAIEMIRNLRPVLVLVQRSDSQLASQLRRAAASVPLNIAEGLRRRGRDRGHLLDVARGSAAEVGAIMDVCAALGVVPDEQAGEVAQAVDRIGAMLYRLRG